MTSQDWRQRVSEPGKDALDYLLHAAGYELFANRSWSRLQFSRIVVVAVRLAYLIGTPAQDHVDSLVQMARDHKSLAQKLRADFAADPKMRVVVPDGSDDFSVASLIENLPWNASSKLIIGLGQFLLKDPKSPVRVRAAAAVALGLITFRVHSECRDEIWKSFANGVIELSYRDQPKLVRKVFQLTEEALTSGDEAAERKLVKAANAIVISIRRAVGIGTIQLGVLRIPFLNRGPRRPLERASRVGLRKRVDGLSSHSAVVDVIYKQDATTRRQTRNLMKEGVGYTIELFLRGFGPYGRKPGITINQNRFELSPRNYESFRLCAIARRDGLSSAVERIQNTNGRTRISNGISELRRRNGKIIAGLRKYLNSLDPPLFVSGVTGFNPDAKIEVLPLPDP